MWKFRDDLKNNLSKTDMQDFLRANSQSVPKGESAVSDGGLKGREHTSFQVYYFGTCFWLKIIFPCLLLDDLLGKQVYVPDFLLLSSIINN